MNTAGNQGTNMSNTLRNNTFRSALLSGALAALLLAGGGAVSAANVTVSLCATTGVTTGAAIVPALPVWGYSSGACSALTAPGGPVIDVTVGDVVTVNLTNALPEATGLLFQGQTGLVPDTSGAAASVGTKTYSFTATAPGTFLYQAAPLRNAEHQVAMGLYGALIVRPAAAVSRPTTGNASVGSALVADTGAVASDVGSRATGTGILAGTTVVSVVPGVSVTLSASAGAGATGPVTLSKSSAYGAADTAYDEEAVMVLSEIDPSLNSPTAPATRATFDMRNFAPKYFLINGKAYPDTAPITTTAGHKLLLRYVNAGAKHHSMGVLGLRQSFIAKDGSVLPTRAVSVTAETLATGQTGDALIRVPVAATANKYVVYDANLNLHNSAAGGFGGMLTFANAAAAGSGVTGPVTSAVLAAPNPTNGLVDVALTATVINSNSTVAAAAEYFIDAVGADGTGTAMTLVPATTSYTATLLAATVAGLTQGPHTLYVHGRDATNAWGQTGSTVLNFDNVGPLTSPLAFTPNPAGATDAVVLTATASDATTGGSNVVAAEYTVDNGAAVAMTLAGSPASSRSLSATIAAGLTEGVHTVTVRSQDAAGNWGALVNGSLTVASVVTTGVTATPNPANGTADVALSATITSTSSTVAAAEYFIDVVGANGFGASMSPVPATTTYSALLLAANVVTLTQGAHTIFVHGQDTATSAWGSVSSTVLNIDKVGPVTSALTMTPNPANLTQTITLAASASDVANGNGNIQAAEYTVDGTAAVAMTLGGSPGPARALSATILPGTLTVGPHAISVRSQDALGNWGTPVAGTLTIISPVTASAVVATPNPTNGAVNVTLTATVANATAAEYFIDAVGADGTGTAMTGAAPSYTATLLSTTIAALTQGPHTIYVHGRDASAWGAASSTILVIDKVGPVTSALTLTPNPALSTQTVALSASASDVAGGGSSIVAAEYTIDGGAALPMTLGGSPAVVRALTATIAAGLSPGIHTIAVRSQDALLNWGPSVTSTLTIASVVTSNVTVAKSPNNGALPLSSSQPVVRVTASMTVTGSTINGAEAFIDVVGANGAGFPLVPSDGHWRRSTPCPRPLAEPFTLSWSTARTWAETGGARPLATWSSTVRSRSSRPSCSRRP
jgi:FtsP/CotA-like multicopper oxidase with cupredoxin domain